MAVAVAGLTAFRQSGHGRRVAQAHYAIDGAFLHRLGPELITAFEQASIAWHQLWALKSSGSGGAATSTYRAGKRARIESGRGGAATSTYRAGKRARIESGSGGAATSTYRAGKRARIESGSGVDSAMIGLQRIYQDANAKPRSEGQASALQLVHNPSSRPLIIVLPTSSGKSALFFSVAAMTQQQTVIVVVPFAALVDDIVERGRKARLQCEEWRDEQSGHELQQLVVVSADRAVSGEFLHYAKGLELNGQLAQVFFDECHVAFTDTSYRERLRELWSLRYLDCPFTGLTATLMVQLEEVLKERLCIPKAVVFQRSTARRTIRYRVMDSRYKAVTKEAVEFIKQLPALPQGKKGVVYVRSYAVGEKISEALQCSFYKARAKDKEEIL